MYDEVLMHARDLDAFKREVAAVGGRVRHVLTPHLVVVAFPKRARETPFRNGATVEAELLAGRERSLAEAWIGQFGVVSQPRVRNAALARAPAARGDVAEKLPNRRTAKPPLPPARPIPGTLASTNTPTSVTFTGSVAVGVVMVSGPPAGPTWTQIEGALIDVSVSPAGHVWGVNFKLEIFERYNNHWRKIDGRLKQISVGDYDKIWGVNAQNEIYTRQGDAWTQVSGSLTHVAVASDGTVCGVNASNEIFRRVDTPDGKGKWQAVPGRLKQISVGSASLVWGVNADNEIFEWSGDAWASANASIDGHWTKQPGKLRRVSVASDGSVFGVNAEHAIYRWLGSEWEQLTGKLTAISAGSSTVVWGVNRDQEIYTGISGLNLALTDVDKFLIQSDVMGALAWLATADANANLSFVYDWQEPVVSAAPGRGDDYEDFEAPWRNAALAAMGFAASAEGSRAYVRSLIDRERADWGYVVYFTKYPLHWPWYAGGERVVMRSDGSGTPLSMRIAHETCHIFGASDEYGDCDCDSSGHNGVPNNNCVNCTSSPVPCVMDDNTKALCTWTRGQLGWNAWTKVPGSLVCVGVGADGTVWGVNADDAIFRLKDGSWQDMPGALKQISVGDAMHVWGVNAANRVFQWSEDDGWTEMGGSLKHVSAASDGTVWGIKSNGDILVRDVNGWVEVPGALTQISVGSAGNIWGVNADDEIYQRTGNSWTKVSGALVHVAVASDGTVWGVNADDAIFRYTGSAWERIHGELTQISVGADGLVWGVNADDAIYTLV